MKIAVLWGDIELSEVLARYTNDCSSLDCICWKEKEDEAKKFVRKMCGATVILPARIPKKEHK